MESIMYAGTDHGVVTARSSDGHSWEVAEGGLKEWAVKEVTVVPGAPNQVLAGTRGDGVWLSEDFGKSWRKPCYGKRGPGKVISMTIDPSNPHRVYAGCEPIDVFVSEDLAQSWVRLDSVWDDPFIATIPYPMATVEPHVRDIVVDPADPDTLYAALQVGYILKSTDGGERWRLLNKGLDCDVHTVVVDPRDSRRVVIATGGSESRTGRAPGQALYLSEDGGDSWVPVAMNFYQEYSVPLVGDPHGTGTFYSALANGTPNTWRKPSGAESTVIRSRDGGKTWEQLDVGGDESSKRFTDAIVVDDERPGRVYLGGRDGDLRVSEDGGDSWEHLDLNIPGLADLKLAHV